MGIYDREYYRKEGPSFIERISNTRPVCRWLIAINVVVLLLQFITRSNPELPPDLPPEIREVMSSSGMGPSWITEWGALTTKDVLKGQAWRFVTHMFLHSTTGILHIIFNMLCLWWFGSVLEDIYGAKEFLAFYLLSGLVGGIAYFLWDWSRGGNSSAVGASGAVTGLLILYACRFPTDTIYMFYFLPVPVWFFAGYSVFQDILPLIQGTAGHMGVGVVAHLGGATVGLVYFLTDVHLISSISNLWSRLRFQRRLSRSSLRPYNPDADLPPSLLERSAASRERSTAVVSGGAVVQSDVDEQMEAKLDAVLEKIGRHGKESLSDAEQAILARASEIYKRRRQ